MLINRSLLSCNLLIVSFKHPPDKIWKIHFIGGGGCVQGSSTTYKKNSRRIYCQTFWRFPGPTFLKTSVQESPRFMSTMTSLHPLILFSPWKNTLSVLALLIVYPPRGRLHQINMFGRLHGHSLMSAAACPHLSLSSSLWSYYTRNLTFREQKDTLFPIYGKCELCLPLQFIIWSAGGNMASTTTQHTIHSVWFDCKTWTPFYLKWYQLIFWYLLGRPNVESDTLK